MKSQILWALVVLLVAACAVLLVDRFAGTQPASSSDLDGADGAAQPPAPIPPPEGACAEHGVEEADCPYCHPEIIAQRGHCAEHDVPEALCTRCQPGIAPAFQAVGDWCAGHDVPESQCTLCSHGAAPDVPCPHRLHAGGCPFCDPGLAEEGSFCLEHGVAEALCVPCQPELADAFRLAGDWCAPHEVPESQCVLCGHTPQAPPDGGDPSSQGVAQGGETPRIQRPPNGHCATEQNVVRLASPDIARRAGLETLPVQARPVANHVEGEAQLAYDANRTVHLSPQIAGVVDSVAVDLGHTVNQGDVLAVLDCLALGEAKAELGAALDRLETAQLKVERAESLFQRKNRLEVQLAAVELLEAEALLKTARENLEREEGLKARGATSDQAVLERRATVLGLEARRKSLQEKLRLFGVTVDESTSLSWEQVHRLEGRGTASEQEVLDARLAVQAIEAEVLAARRRLAILGLDEKAIGEVEEVGDTSSLLELVAPFPGEVVARHAVEGEVVEAGRILFTVTDPKRLWALIDVYEEDASRVAVEQPVELQLGGLPGRVPARITWVSPALDPRTRTLKARAEVANPDGRLKAHMFARARITVHENGALPVVPKGAVQWEGCCNVVFLKESDTTFRPRKVSILGEDGGDWIVEQGVAPGDEVVTTGSFLLKTELKKGSIGAGCCEVPGE